MISHVVEAAVVVVAVVVVLVLVVDRLQNHSDNRSIDIININKIVFG